MRHRSAVHRRRDQDDRAGGEALTRAAIVCLSAGTALAAPAAAQHGLAAHLSGQGVFVGTYVDPIPGGGTLGETRLVQPIVMLDAGAWHHRLLIHATADFEGLTIPNGELAPGDWGEGFADRRHPHTYLHELIVSAPDLLGRLDGSARVAVCAGKGFVPFGTDDPMSRPVERFPINHHLSQILERALAMAAVAVGRVTVEASLFNGDEPESPGQAPRWSRFGDSWSARLTLRPIVGVEGQVSTATVASPENRAGAGPAAHKWSASLRAERPAGGGRWYALVEWARTSEAEGFFVFHSALAEAAFTAGRHQSYYRFERTERPEEMRAADPFRTVRPHLDNSVLGIDRWSVHTVGYAARLGPRAGSLDVRPFVELSYGRVATVSGAFDPATFYGRPTFWTASGGVRVGWGMAGHRMGHYGAPMDAMPGMMPH